MAINANPELYRSRLRRLRILQALSQSYPEALGDRMILAMLRDDMELQPDADKVRRSLQYLEDRGFASITDRTDELWIAKATPDGIDYLEGADPALAGLAHPSEFMG